MNHPDLNPPSTTTPLHEPRGDALNHTTMADRHDSGSPHHPAREAAMQNVAHWRHQAGAWREGASDHIRAHPMRSMFIATGTGILLTLLLRAVSR